jgi:hypothetical protein
MRSLGWTIIAQKIGLLLTNCFLMIFLKTSQKQGLCKM